MSAAVINGGLVHYEAFGRGNPPILFIHGWLGSWRYWMQTMESLAVDNRVYAVDLWGFGDSDKSERRFSLDQQTNLVDGFIRELGLDSPIIVGHALGAVVAIDYAAIQGVPVDKVMAVSLPLSADTIDRRLSGYSQSSLLSKMLRWKPIPNKEIEEEAARAADKVIAVTLESFASHNDALDKLKRLNCTVLIVFGERDEVIDATPVQKLNNSLNHIRHITLPDAKHFPMVDDGPKFNRLLKDFVDPNNTLDDLDLKDEWRRRTR